MSSTNNEWHNGLPSPPRDSDDKFVGPISPPPFSPPRSESPAPISLPDGNERMGYYYGLPSKPPLLARTGTKVWTHPLRPTGFSPRKYLKNVGHHQRLSECWDKMSLDLCALLDKHDIIWTSIDLVRIGCDESDMPIVLWIGVKPGTLIDENCHSLPIAGKTVVACQQILEQNGIFDIECELRESDSYHHDHYSPALRQTSETVGAAVDIEVYLSSTIGTCIAADDFSAEGTFGFYLTFPDRPGKLFGVTCRHLFFDLEKNNQVYNRKHTSQKARPVLLPGTKYLEELKKRTEESITNHEFIVKTYSSLVNTSSEQGFYDALVTSNHYHLEILKKLHMDMKTQWETADSRTIGHIVYSPPINASSSPDNYNLDWCLYEVDPSKVRNFSGNVIELGCDLAMTKITDALNSNIKNAYKFTYPPSRLWPVQNAPIPISEMKNPQTWDKKNSQALSVLKRGRTTMVTCGVASEFVSITRYYLSDGTSYVTKEWAIVGADESFSPFSREGDSGALIVDAQGRPGGMLTGGGGHTAKTDVTYATPIVALFEDMERNGWHRPSFNVVVR